MNNISTLQGFEHYFWFLPQNQMCTLKAIWMSQKAFGGLCEASSGLLKASGRGKEGRNPPVLHLSMCPP